jgi:hypothetical protein
VTHVSARHLPPMVRRRPLGPLAQVHAGVEAGLAAVRVWLYINDPGLLGADGFPACDEFACRMWGCWCPRAPIQWCEHGIDVEVCEQCPDPIVGLAEIQAALGLTGDGSR